MSRMLQYLRLARWLGIAGAVLGILAGILQATIGPQIPQLTGSKNSPPALGMLTIILCLIALVSAISLARVPLGMPRRLAATAGLLIPGLLGFTTVGILSYLPGCLLLAATMLALLSGDARESRRFVVNHWLAGAIGVLGLLEVMLALGTGVLWVAATGVVGGLAVVVAPWIARRSVQIALLVLGAVPFAVLTWWSVASPLLAALALGIGFVAIRRVPVAGGRRLVTQHPKPEVFMKDETEHALVNPR